MTDQTSLKPEDTPLNPAMKSRTEQVYDTSHSTPAPIDTASGHSSDGRSWPWIWLIVTALCIGVAIWLILLP